MTYGDTYSAVKDIPTGELANAMLFAVNMAVTAAHDDLNQAYLCGMNADVRGEFVERLRIAAKRAVNLAELLDAATVTYSG